MFPLSLRRQRDFSFGLVAGGGTRVNAGFATGCSRAQAGAGMSKCPKTMKRKHAVESIACSALPRR